MSTTVNGLRLRRVLGRRAWSLPTPFGADGWALRSVEGDRSVIVSVAELDGVEWIHASMTGRDEVPTYDDLCRLREAAFGDGYAYQVFAPPADHVNIHDHALHLWGRVDGRPALPEFGFAGTI